MIHGQIGTPDFPELGILARAYLALLGAYEDRSAAFERAAADCVRLEKALRATFELAAVANEGDPWYAEREGLDAEAILAQAREALAATPKPVVEEEKDA